MTSVGKKQSFRHNVIILNIYDATFINIKEHATIGIGNSRKTEISNKKAGTANMITAC